MRDIVFRSVDVFAGQETRFRQWFRMVCRERRRAAAQAPPKLRELSKGLTVVLRASSGSSDCFKADGIVIRPLMTKRFQSPYHTVVPLGYRGAQGARPTDAVLWSCLS